MKLNWKRKNWFRKIREVLGMMSVDEGIDEKRDKHGSRGNGYGKGQKQNDAWNIKRNNKSDKCSNYHANSR